MGYQRTGGGPYTRVPATTRRGVPESHATSERPLSRVRSRSRGSRSETTKESPAIESAFCPRRPRSRRRTQLPTGPADSLRGNEPFIGRSHISVAADDRPDAKGASICIHPHSG